MADNKIQIIQIATTKEIYIFDLLALRDDDETKKLIIDILEDEKI